jgi:hypothetical protein
MKNSMSLRAALFVSLIISFSSCSRDKSHPGKNEHSNAAPAHIRASEKLLIPDAVALPSDLSSGTARVATYYAAGVQRYKASPKTGDPASFQWVLVGPDAALYDATGAKVGSHGTGPFWQLAPADSIFAQHFNPARTAPSPDPASIDWLLLKPKTGPTPTGIFADVDFVQRIATKGGKAPLAAPLSLTDTVQVKYQAVYRFSKILP